MLIDAAFDEVGGAEGTGAEAPYSFVVGAMAEVGGGIVLRPLEGGMMG